MFKVKGEGQGRGQRSGSNVGVKVVERSIRACLERQELSYSLSQNNISPLKAVDDGRLKN